MDKVEHERTGVSHRRSGADLVAGFARPRRWFQLMNGLE
jgi:hypothetical protein